MTLHLYTVPAAKPLTVLHILNQAREGDGEEIRGYTMCGQPLKTEELWIPIQFRQEDRLCPGCVRNVSG